jgi:hypothetical protein
MKKEALVASALLLCPLLTATARAQCSASLTQPIVVRTRSDFKSVEHIEIPLLQAIVPSVAGEDEVVPKDRITFKRLPSNQTVKGTDVVELALAMSESGFRELLIQTAPTFTWQPGTDKELEITLGPITLQCGAATIIVKAKVVDSSSSQLDQFALAKTELEKATAYATPVDQKNFYAMVAAAKGSDGDGAGAADISIDQTVFSPARQVGALFDNAAIKFMTKKSTGANADPRTQLVGVEFTKALLWGAANRARKGEEITANERTNLLSARGWTRGMVIYELLNLEGDAYDFNAVNFVSDTQFTVPSIAKRLGTRGFWNFRVLTGTEIGRSRRQPDAGTAPTVTSTAISDYIVRSKLGADVALRWGRADADPSKFAIELDAGHVTRFLYQPESALKDIVADGKTTQERVTIEKGQRHWTQVNLRVFLFGTEQARYGVQLTYYNGSLPPLFAQANAFQFGMVIDAGPTTTSATR